MLESRRFFYPAVIFSDQLVVIEAAVGTACAALERPDRLLVAKIAFGLYRRGLVDQDKLAYLTAKAARARLDRPS